MTVRSVLFLIVSIACTGCIDPAQALFQNLSLMGGWTVNELPPEPMGDPPVTLTAGGFSNAIAGAQSGTLDLQLSSMGAEEVDYLLWFDGASGYHRVSVGAVGATEAQVDYSFGESVCNGVTGSQSVEALFIAVLTSMVDVTEAISWVTGIFNMDCPGGLGGGPGPGPTPTTQCSDWQEFCGGVLMRACADNACNAWYEIDDGGISTYPCSGCDTNTCQDAATTATNNHCG